MFSMCTAIKNTLPLPSYRPQPNEGETTPEALVARLKALAYDNIYTTLIGELAGLAAEKRTAWR